MIVVNGSQTTNECFEFVETTNTLDRMHKKYLPKLLVVITICSVGMHKRYKR